jgi:hypothetical protein
MHSWEWLQTCSIFGMAFAPADIFRLGLQDIELDLVLQDWWPSGPDRVRFRKHMGGKEPARAVRLILYMRPRGVI